MKKFLKNNYIYLLSFIIGLTIIFILYAINKVSPFGGKSLLTVDFFHQYAPMLGEYFDRIKNGSNLIYSFNLGLGVPIFRNFLNYLSSPFNIIILLFKRKHLLTAFSIIIALKCATATSTMTYYLSKKFKTKNLLVIGISILYTFQAYFIAYYWNIMWIDGLIFLPIIILGIEDIINKGTWKLYTISLGIMLLTNYFIGYMICIYSILYFIFYLIYKTSFTKKTVKKDLVILLKRLFLFGRSSLIAGALSAFMLIPLFTSISSISATHDTMPTTQYYDFEFSDFIKGHISAVETTVFSSDNITNPNVSCGIISVALVLLFIINYNIPLKKKLCYLGLLLVIASCFMIPQLDFIMHAFHVPNDLPYRYSFLYSFTFLLIAAYSLYHLKDLKFIITLLVYIALLILLIILIFNKWTDITTNLIIINIIILSLVFLFYSYVYFYKNMYLWFAILFIIIASVDVIVSTNRNWTIQQEIKNFYYNYEDIEKSLRKIKDDELFYRIEKSPMLTYNDPSWYNYHGINTFSSMAYENMAILQGKLGVPGNKINSYYYVNQTPVYDMMFNLKYFIGIKDYDDIKYENIDFNLNKFKYSLPLAFGVNNNINDWNYKNNNPFIVQNDFISQSSNVYDVFSPIKIQNRDYIYKDGAKRLVKYTIESSNNNLYFYSSSRNIDYFIIGDSLYTTSNVDSNNLDLSYLNNLNITYDSKVDYDEAGIINITSDIKIFDIYVYYNVHLLDDFYLYQLNDDIFEEAYKELSKYPLTITSFKENDIKGTIYVPEEMTLYTSIPYDKGWKVYVDGKKVKTEALGDALLTIKLDKGNHTINFKYQIPNFLIGIFITISSIIYIIVDEIIKRKRILKK